MLDFLVSFAILIYVIGSLSAIFILGIYRVWIVFRHKTSKKEAFFIICLPLSYGIFKYISEDADEMPLYTLLMTVFLCLQVLGSFYIIYTYIG